ncbi:hypothetical protein [Streptomyces sp. NPDC059863]|uniref:hypothetical protein n=1 Tax=unclassified Streptomyces TaxID=2593676 RepID=UPI0036508D7D
MPKLLPTSRDKTRAIFLVYEADTYLRARRPEQAAAAAQRSLSLSTRIGAPRCVAMTRDLLPAFRPYTTAQGVPDLMRALTLAG